MIETAAPAARRSPTLMFSDALSATSFFKRPRLSWCVLALSALAALLYDVFRRWLEPARLAVPHELAVAAAAAAGIYPALIGTMYLIALTTVLALPVGIAAAIYLEEYGTGNWLARLIEINIANLAGVPSIIYGLLGLGLFVRTLGFGRSVLAGRGDDGAARAADRDSFDARSAADGAEVYARRLVRARRDEMADDLAPGAAERDAGLFTGVILALSRAIGETAPLITIGALTYVPFAPDSIWSPFTVLPIQIFNWLSRPQVAFARERRGRHHRPARAAAVDERRRDRPPRSLSAAPQIEPATDASSAQLLALRLCASG